MTQDYYQKAMKFAGEKHYQQKVPGSKSNYLLHLTNVAMEVFMAYINKKKFDIDYAIQLAVLHDTIEDTTADYNEIKTTFGERVAIGVNALTKNENLSSKKERMLDSLNRIDKLSNEVALVKLADRITNLQCPPYYWSKEKIENYLQEAKLISDILINKNEYLNNRLQEKIKEYEVYILNK
nr:HD domain-containing protein [uncultured Marinifilum sp.]